MIGAARGRSDGGPTADTAYGFGWGANGVAELSTTCDVIVIVDVLRFTTAVAVAVGNGATVFPARWNRSDAAATAAANGAVLAGRREDGPVSLSPTDLLALSSGSRLVLPSPNGSALTIVASEAGVPFVLAGALRNAAATARRALTLANGGRIAVVAAGERWPDGSLRPCVEDLLGAGAIIAALDPAGATAAPRSSPEAAAARAAFLDARPMLHDALARCRSGLELDALGFGDDVATAAASDVCDLAAELVDGAYVGR